MIEQEPTSSKEQIVEQLVFLVDNFHDCAEAAAQAMTDAKKQLKASNAADNCIKAAHQINYLAVTSIIKGEIDSNLAKALMMAGCMSQLCELYIDSSKPAVIIASMEAFSNAIGNDKISDLFKD